MKTGGKLKSHSRMRNFRKVEGEIKDVWQVDEADRIFSQEIRKRDGCCVNCGSTMFLGCSHYFERGIYNTRFDPENCITLCQECHEKWEHEKHGIYLDYMKMWLGIGFLSLQIRAKGKVSPYQAISEFMKVSETFKNQDIIY